MSVLVVNPGVQSTVQDLGRAGFAAMGVSRSGAADELSLRIGNRLLGNDDNAAAVECALVGGSFRFDRDTCFAVVGATCRPVLQHNDGAHEPVEPWLAARALPGDCLVIGPVRDGARVYLCLAGGVDTPCVLGSRATQVSASGGGVGGVSQPDGTPGRGASLSAGDVLPLATSRGAETRECPGALRQLVGEAIVRRAIRVTDGPQAGLLDPLQREALANISFTVSDQSNRVGLRLVGGDMPCVSHGNMLTQPVSHGFVQVTPSGELIILGPDAPPTGGYPVVASVASVDLPCLGQLRPRDTLRVEWISHREARSRLLEYRMKVDALLPPA